MGRTTTSKQKEQKTFMPALTPEARENQIISLAYDEAEKRIRDGTASSQLIAAFVKMGSTKERIERDILSQQKELIMAKTEAIKSAKRVEELYADAIKAMRKYSGAGDSDE